MRLNLLLSYAGWQPESWADRLPQLLEPMGVRSLRAGTGREASDVIRSNRIHIAVVDLGLPLDRGGDGSRGGPVGGRAAGGDLPGKTPANPCPSQEEAGARILELLGRLQEPPPTVVVKRSLTHRDDRREIAAALRAGAFAVVDRPRDSGDLELMLEVLRRCLTRYYQGRWPGLRSSPS